jgi:hypothetical protein
MAKVKCTCIVCGKEFWVESRVIKKGQGKYCSRTCVYATTLEDRFYSKIAVTETGCHEWQANRLPSGYGSFWLNGTNRLAHRVAWELVNGEIPDGLNVLHKCDNPKCVRAEHLFLGTTQDNVADRERKGRNRPPKGEQCGTHKLTEIQVIEIRERYAAGGILLRELAIEYGVGKAAIGKITRRERWAHIQDT